MQVFGCRAKARNRDRSCAEERFRTTPAPITGQLYGDKSVAGLTHEVVNTIIVEKAAVPHSANSLRKVLRHMLDHAVDINMIKINPALRIKRLKTAACTRGPTRRLPAIATTGRLARKCGSRWSWRW